MANLQARVAVNLKEGTTTLLERALTSQGVNSKVVLDDVFDAGVLDLAPYLASIDVPSHLLIVIGNDTGATLDMGGGGPYVFYSTLAAKTIYLELASAAPIDLALTTADAARIRVLAIGDPD